MMFPQPNPQPKPNPRRESEDCEIEVKKTKTGKKIRFSKRCSPTQMKILAEQNGINLGEEN